LRAGGGGDDGIADDDDDAEAATTTTRRGGDASAAEVGKPKGKAASGKSTTDGKEASTSGEAAAGAEGAHTYNSIEDPGLVHGAVSRGMPSHEIHVDHQVTPMGDRSFIRAGKTFTLALISWFGRGLLLHFRSRGEAWRG